MAKEYVIKRVKIHKSSTAEASIESREWAWLYIGDKTELESFKEEDILQPGDEIYSIKKEFTVKQTIKLEK